MDEEELIDGESKPDELYTLCDDPMQVPIKLIDEQLRFVNLATVQDLFVDNSGFLVVGAIGLQVTRDILIFSREFRVQVNRLC